jgi:hypothetical protein
MSYRTMKNQQGFNTIGLLMWVSVIIIVAIMGMRLIPAYMEHATIQRTLNALASETEVSEKSTKEIRQSFNKYAQIDNIKVVSGRDLKFKRKKEKLTIEVTYSVKTPLFANVSLFIDFEATAGN